MRKTEEPNNKKRSGSKRTRGDVALIVLGTVAAMGLITALLVAPGLGHVLKLIDRNPRRAMDKLQRALKRLVQDDSLSHAGNTYRFTPAGRRKFARLRFEAYEMPKRKTWDKKWRIICFDIPETKRYARLRVQRKLQELGFCRLQDSVFAYPHPCGELAGLIQIGFGLERDVRGMVVTQMDNDRLLRLHFHLAPKET